jgi:hypothetical protein
VGGLGGLAPRLGVFRRGGRRQAFALAFLALRDFAFLAALQRAACLQRAVRFFAAVLHLADVAEVARPAALES